MIDRQVYYTPQIIKKSNLLIEKNNYLTAVNHKIFNCVISQAQQFKLLENTLKIPVRKVVNLVGKKEVYRTELFFRHIGKNLVSNVLDLIDPTNDSCDITNLIGRFKLENSIIQVKLSDEFIELINIEKDYTKIDLNIVNKLKSKHSMVLYEYLLMKLKYKTYHIKNKNFANVYCDLEKLKKLLCNNSKSYDNTNLFKHKLLKIALEEINAKTDLNIHLQDVKCDFNNKTIVGFEFTINQTEIKQILVPNLEEIKPILDIKHSVDIDLSQYPKQVEEIINIGIKPASKVIKWFEEDQRRLLANWYEISTKYADKSNEEKAKLMAYLWKVNANYVTRAEIEAKEKEMAYNIKQEAILKEQQQKQAKQEAEVKQKANKAFEDTAKIYNQLSNQDKLELCTNICRSNQGVLRLNKCTEKDNYLSFDTLPTSIKAFIMGEINAQKIEQIKQTPQVFLSYNENEKKEADKALRNLLM